MKIISKSFAYISCQSAKFTYNQYVNLNRVWKQNIWKRSENEI